MVQKCFCKNKTPRVSLQHFYCVQYRQPQKKISQIKTTLPPPQGLTLLWFSQGIPVVSRGIPRDFHGTSHGNPWDSHRNPWDPHGTSHGNARYFAVGYRGQFQSFPRDSTPKPTGTHGMPWHAAENTIMDNTHTLSSCFALGTRSTKKTQSHSVGSTNCSRGIPRAQIHGIAWNAVACRGKHSKVQ